MAPLDDTLEWKPVPISENKIQGLDQMTRMIVVNAPQRDPFLDEHIGIQRDIGVGADDSAQRIAPAHPEHLQAGWDHAGMTANLDHRVDPVGRRHSPDLGHYVVLVTVGDIDNRVGPELLRRRDQ